MTFIRNATHWILSLLFILLVLLTSIRLLLTPLFLEFEYNKPAFPVDTYGFSTEDRLYYARYAVDYLLNDEDINYLADLTFENGDQLFIERELSHMIDVKMLVQLMLNIWYAILLIVFIAILFFILRNNSIKIYLFLQHGSILTLGFIGIILISLGISFSALFTGFHRIFFEGDTWIFLYSDSLIRLFPMKFWQDAFILIGVISILLSCAALVISRIAIRKLSKKDPSL